jgi:hypothetical protein
MGAFNESAKLYAPKGQESLAQGFNLGNLPKPHRALKGRQTEHGENARLPCNHLSPPGMSKRQRVECFRANRLMGWFPGVETPG